MSRFLSPIAGEPLKVLALVAAVAVLGSVAAGCGSSGHRAAISTASTPKKSAPCKLNKAQRRTVAKAQADIRRLRQIQAPVHAFSQRGVPGQEEMTGKFLLDIGATNLPPNVFANLLHEGKVAVNLCGDCANGLEADEPFFGNRSGSPCG